MSIDSKDIMLDLIEKTPKGQRVGRDYSSLRLTHIPTGIIIEIPYNICNCQHKRKELALKMLQIALD